MRLAPCWLPLTVSVYVPGGVPGSPPPLLVAALHAARDTSATSAISEGAVAALIRSVRRRQRKKLIKLISARMIMPGPRRPPGDKREGAVVVTVMVKRTAEEVFTLSEPGDGVQIASAGAPAQARLTAPAKPFIGINCKLNVAVCPAETVADVEPPLAG